MRISIELGGNGHRHPGTILVIVLVLVIQQAATYSIAAVAGSWTILVLHNVPKRRLSVTYRACCMRLNSKVSMFKMSDKAGNFLSNYDNLYSPQYCSSVIKTNKNNHRRKSSINFRGTTFLPEKYVWKINKMPEFYTIIARKIFFPIFLWGVTCPPSPVSCAYENNNSNLFGMSKFYPNTVYIGLGLHRKTSNRKPRLLLKQCQLTILNCVFCVIVYVIAYTMKHVYVTRA